ncbi:MAG TPA: DinB family protein [Candidatus Acidoferrales bacterium]|nr:DinB family protein [Candidatus Acidoferrales bacterium]
MHRFLNFLAAAALVLSLAAPAALSQAQAPAAPSVYKAEITRSIEDAEKKLVALAEKFPQEKYGWHPEGARTTSEVFMHIAAGNYGYSTLMGAPRPEGKTSAVLSKITDKAQVVQVLKDSFAYIKTAVANVPDVEKAIKLYGHDSSVREAMLVAATHCHEHMGQLIAYARVNGIVPPWTEEAAARAPAKN